MQGPAKLTVLGIKVDVTIDKQVQMNGFGNRIFIFLNSLLVISYNYVVGNFPVPPYLQEVYYI